MLTIAKIPLFKFGANIRKFTLTFKNIGSSFIFLIEKVRKFRTVTELN